MRKGCQNAHARCAMTSNSFRARFSGILEALEKAAEPAQGNTKIGSTSACAKGPKKKKRASGESNFGYGHFADAFFFGPKKYCPNA